MARNWTFGQKIGGGFAVTVALALVIGAVAVYALRSVVEAKDSVIDTYAQMLLDTARAESAIERKVAAGRGYMLSREERFLERVREARGEFSGILERLKQNAQTDQDRRLLAAIERDEAVHHTAVEQVAALRRSDITLEALAAAFEEQAAPRREQLRADMQTFVERVERLMHEANRAATLTSSSAIAVLAVVAVFIVLLSSLLAFILSRALSRQIGTAVGQVQSSSAELQSAANQQATATKEQATAMSEITTTITELLATSKQIAESAQRVAHIAEQTASSARTGDTTVDKAHESITAIRRQVDLIVSHMLELGKKSQLIGAVLDIVAELAEQTNILAINATIEAAGAGEQGKRFAVVADEIRKLADRVAGSTKEIRSLIEDIRSSVNTTVMTTETGSKAVDAGTRQFSEVASTFKRIAGMVGTTTEAAREIELSTKQQSTAVEQVNVAITNVAQATKETETSSGQTLQTAGQLSALSRDLLRLVQPQAPVHAVHPTDRGG